MTSVPAIQHLEQALALATQSLNITSPNPRVGCVITNSAGLLLGQGLTQRAGGPHAEIMALQDAQTKGYSVKGATAYVTLEPCAHHGRTGPCCDALIAAGLQKVVATNLDPNPLVAGQGFARLRAAGVDLDVLPPEHPLAIASRELNIGFFSRMIRKTPWVRMKLAASLDGQTALQ
ncbi:MAG: riboflavin biosynthesis protein RibD, partial [Comamonadaceae bacterium CG17_big_fil_post_rev_8_21_14_2_50_60_13]